MTEGTDLNGREEKACIPNILDLHNKEGSDDF